MPTKGSKLLDVIIPGKAYEIAIGKLNGPAIEALKKGEQRKKGRGYRVFTKLEQSQAEYLAKYFEGLDPKAFGLVDAQAIKNARDRLFEASGLERIQPPTPTITSEPKVKGPDNRGRKLREKTAKEVWGKIFPMIETHRCHCELRPGMDLNELKALGAGCTDPHDYKYKILKQDKPSHMTDIDRLVALSDSPGYICPVLDTYRRAVEKLTPKKDD